MRFLRLEWICAVAGLAMALLCPGLAADVVASQGPSHILGVVLLGLAWPFAPFFFAGLMAGQPIMTALAWPVAANMVYGWAVGRFVRLGLADKRWLGVPVVLAALGVWFVCSTLL